MVWRCGYCRLDVGLRATMALILLRAVQGDGCPDPVPTLVADFTEQNLYSPSYPNHYSNNLDCVWVLDAADNVSEEFGIQVATTEIQLDEDYGATTVGQCETDYLQIYTGTPSNLGQLVGTWCGSDRQAFTTSSKSLTLKFHTDSHRTGRGFVLEYAMVKLASPACQVGSVRKIFVGQAPVYVGFTVNGNDNNCTWRLETVDTSGATDLSAALVVEALSIPRIQCNDGKFILYDGPNSSSQPVLRWCNGGEAFSTIYLQSNLATLTFVRGTNLKFTSDMIELKLYSRNLRFPQICSQQVMPEVHVGRGSTYFHVPFLKNGRGEQCSVNVSHATENNYLRVDVMTITGHLPTCDTDVVSVTTDGSKQIITSCNRGQYLMYTTAASFALVSSAEEVFLRAISSDPVCSGVSLMRLATTSLILEDTIPKGFLHGITTQNCVSKYLITTESESLTVALKLLWTVPLLQDEGTTGLDSCPGDVVSVYDGNNESSPLLYSTCHKLSQHVMSTITGTGSSMLVVFHSEDVANSNLVKFSYLAVPKSTECTKMQQIMVIMDEQELTSPNYPQFYSLDHDCRYNITAENPTQVVVIEVVDSWFSSGCHDVIQIFDGDTGVPLQGLNNDTCRQNMNQKFVSSHHQAVIRFRSNEMGVSGGWKLKLYSQKRATSCGDPLQHGHWFQLLLNLLAGTSLVFMLSPGHFLI